MLQKLSVSLFLCGSERFEKDRRSQYSVVTSLPVTDGEIEPTRSGVQTKSIPLELGSTFAPSNWWPLTAVWCAAVLTCIKVWLFSLVCLGYVCFLLVASYLYYWGKRFLFVIPSVFAEDVPQIITFNSANELGWYPPQLYLRQAD